MPEQLLAVLATREPILVVAGVRVRRSPTAFSPQLELWLVRRNATGSHGGLAGLWEFPGGKVELGETVSDALHREWMEELETRITIGNDLGVVHSLGPGGEVYAVHFRLVTPLDPPVVSRCHDRERWFSLEDTAMIDQLPSGKEFTRQLLLGVRLMLSVLGEELR